MADDDAEQQGPSLEPPKLFRRRPRRSTPATPVPDPAPDEASDVTTPDGPDPDADEAELSDDPIVVETPREGPTKDGSADSEASDDDEAAMPSAPVATASTSEPEPSPEPEPAPEPASEPEPAPEVATSRAIGANRTEDVEADQEDEPGFTDAATVPVHVGDDQDERVPDPAPAAVEPEPREPREPRGPLLVGRNAALATGLLVGVLILLLGAGASATCEAVRGTSACGAALGLPLLAVIIALAVVAGALLLRLFRVPDPAATSFMAVALVAVVTGLFLTDALDSWAVRIAYPVGVALAYLASWWLAVSFDDPAVVRAAREEREQTIT